MSLLDELLAKVSPLDKDNRQTLAVEILQKTDALKWVPSPGPQTEAYFSKADCLLFGGEPGGGKSQLLLGLAFNLHRKSLLMRREYGDLTQLIDDALKIHGSRNGFNGSPPPRLRINETQTINFRAAQRVGDEQGTMGQGRDLLGIDEATHFAESQVRFLMGWVRTEIPGQRCRTVLATNPPLSTEGMWVIRMFAPWLDPTHPNPAKPGELRWVISDDNGEDLWVDGPHDAREILGKVRQPTSRSYIPSSVRDNPYYVGTEYEKQLDGLTEPFRSLLLGGFRTAFKDHEFQVIPTEWIEAAQRRWTPDGWRDRAMTAMAVDPAGGGNDAQEIAVRYGGWFAPLITDRGPETAEPEVAFGHIMAKRRDSAPVIVDVGGGYGGALLVRLKDNGIPHAEFNGAAATTFRMRGTNIPAKNKRAEAYLRLRQELDPDQNGGSAICLPPDHELKADLAALRYNPDTFHVRGVYQIETKEDLRGRLGRSTGKGDAVAMCLSEGEAAFSAAVANRNPPRVVRGYEKAKNRWR